jgi:hypothetical protein
MTRIDKREIAGASDTLDDAPDLLEVRKSGRARVIEQQWEQAEVLNLRKKLRLTQLPIPRST